MNRPARPDENSSKEEWLAFIERINNFRAQYELAKLNAEDRIKAYDIFLSKLEFEFGAYFPEERPVLK